MAMLASGAEDCAPFKEDKGNWEEGGGDEAEEAEGPGTGEALEHCGDGVSDVNSGGAGGAEDAGEGADAGNAGGKLLTLQNNQRQKSSQAETHGSHGGEGGQGSSRRICIEDVGDQRSEDRLISPDIQQSTKNRARPPDSRARRPANPK